MAFSNGGLMLNFSDELRAHNDRIAGSTIFLISIIGMVCNTYVVFFISRRPSMKNAFGKLSQNQGIADMFSSLIYLTYYAPMVFFDIKFLQDVSITRWFGFLHIVMYDSGNFTHFFASINRLVVIFFPMTYGREFGMTTAKLLNCLAWVLAIVPGFFAYQIGCLVEYDLAGWHYNFADTAVCKNIGLFYTFGKSFILITLIVAFDVVTFIKSRVLRKELRVSLADHALKSRQLDELNFVTQAFLQGMVFASELVSYFVFAAYVDNLWIKFAFTQVAYQLTQTLDGIIIIGFNKEFRRAFRKRKVSSNVHSIFRNGSSKKRTASEFASSERETSRKTPSSCDAVSASNI